MNDDTNNNHRDVRNLAQLFNNDESYLSVAEYVPRIHCSFLQNKKKKSPPLVNCDE